MSCSLTAHLLVVSSINFLVVLLWQWTCKTGVARAHFESFASVPAGDFQQTPAEY